MKYDSQKVASEFIAKAKELGFSYCISGCIVKVNKNFTPRDPAAFGKAESNANTLLSIIPRSSPGSIWGTDGSSVGGFLGFEQGYMELCKSGCNKNILKEINRRS